MPRFGLITVIGLIAISQADPVRAQGQGESPSPPDAVRWIASAQTRVAEHTTLTAGGMYLGGLQMPLAFVTVDQRLDERWSLHAGYYAATRSVAGGSDRRTHFLRAGVIYRLPLGRITLDNRLLYEAVLDGPNREDGNRLRNRTRLTYGLSPQSRLQPRVFAFAEPVLDDRPRASRVDLGIGVGGMVKRGWRLDTYYLRQEYPDRPMASLNAFVIDLTIQLP